MAWKEAAGGEFDPRSRYVERFWLGILGPSACWLLRSLADRFDEEPEGFHLDLDELAVQLGLGRSNGTASVRRVVARCARFQVTQDLDSSTLRARRQLPRVPDRHLRRLPPSLQMEHRRWANPSGTPESLLLGRRARLFALDLRELGLEVEEIEHQLLRRGVRASMAFAAARWVFSPAGENEVAMAAG